MASDPAATVGELIAAGAGRLSTASDSARLDAELLLAGALGVSRTRLVLDRDREVAADVAGRFTALVGRRERGEPVAYLLGHRGFRWLDLAVDSRVLVPRPETELLVELGLSLAPGASVIDVGTGSGALALALAHERPDLRIAAVDVSDDALDVARQNATGLRLDVSFSSSDLLESADGPFDAVLANLPYIADGAPLPPDVADHEPALALYGGGDDGLGLIRRLVSEVAERPWPALLGLEIGEDQGRAVAELVRGAGFAAVEVRRDLAGRDRVVVGRERSGAGHERDGAGRREARAS